MDRRQFFTTAIGAGLTSFFSSSCLKSSLNDNKALLSSSLVNNNNLLTQDKNTSLKAAAHKVKKFYGTAISEADIQQDKDYAQLVASEASIAVTEGAFKWIVIEPLPGQFNFAPADQTINFCSANNLKLRGHTLVWHMAKPDWLSYPPSLSDVERHFTEIMGRYRHNQTLYSWDIINEVIADSPSDAEDQVYGLRKGVKPEYVRDVFQIAASIDNSKEFVINDYGCEDTGWKQDKFLNLVRYLKNSGAKLDAVGLQSHMWFSKNYGWNENGFRNFLKQLKSTGVRPIVTELDVIVDTPLPSTLAELDQMVADGYQKYLNACFAEGVETIITWGLSDKYSWLRHPDYLPKKLIDYKDFIRPLPYDTDLQPKPARNAILKAFRNVKS
ncbi:MAG: endo-1,4-beta-xylanase [Calothrix sp. C42_A2020_038]|nr:endo-1,4-beta-xylanase [Calothrix sp. C42_A2020_038]